MDESPDPSTDRECGTAGDPAHARRHAASDGTHCPLCEAGP
jgi:hypothetical protein